ncbi:MAG: hypothetical protein ABL892_08600 [Thiobacillaceae bacterium]
MLRRLNPDILIFGLYGGNPAGFHDYERTLAHWLDDNWAYNEEKDSEWKWRHGDRMICLWFTQRGLLFEWDTLIVMQWDMLALASVEKLFSMLRPGELYLPGLRPLSEIESQWWWTQPDTEVYDDYIAFKAWLNEHSVYPITLQACQFFTAALPRSFLQRYADIQNPELGFLEYKIPAYASLFGNPVRDLLHLPVNWFGKPPPGKRTTLTTAKAEIPTATIAAERLTPGGARLFHPVTVRFPSARLGLMIWLLQQSITALVRRSRFF